MPFPAELKGLFQVILHYLLIATIAVSDINIVWIAATLATLLCPSGLSLNRQPRSTLGAVGHVWKVIAMAAGTGEVHVEVGTTLFAKF
jgi:hypothetical protein